MVKISFTHMQIIMIIELPSILEPHDFWPWLPSGHTNEHNLVTKNVFIIKVRACYMKCKFMDIQVLDWK